VPGLPATAVSSPATADGSPAAAEAFPTIPAKAGNTIVAAVRSAHTARQRAQALLAAAQRAVEIAIEDSEPAALAYLKTQGGETSAKGSGIGVSPVVLVYFSKETGQAGSLSHYFAALLQRSRDMN
jgi:hypothetical protein